MFICGMNAKMFALISASVHYRYEKWIHSGDKYFGCTTVLTSQHECIHDDNVSNEVHCSPSDRIALIKKALILSMRSNLWTVHGHSTLHQILALNYDSDRHW